MSRGGAGKWVEWVWWSGRGTVGSAPGWSGRAGRPSALPPQLLGAVWWAWRSGVWGKSVQSVGSGGLSLIHHDMVIGVSRCWEARWKFGQHIGKFYQQPSDDFLWRLLDKWEYTVGVIDLFAWS